MLFKKGSEAIFTFYKVFFPFQILLAQLKYNFIALVYWCVLFLIVSGNFGSKFGLNYLFCSPEYLGNIGSWSFFLLGFAIGGFTMSFNIFSYLKIGPKFPFLATLSKPFFKFCLNNSIVPLAFLLYYMYQFSIFQSHEEFASNLDVLYYCLAFLVGLIFFLVIAFAYFFPTNKDFFKISGRKQVDIDKEKPFKSIFHKSSPIDFEQSKREKQYLYFGRRGKIYRSRSIAHYDSEIISKVFAQNKLNASIFELVSIVVFLILGAFREYSFFAVPAATSIILLFTIILMLFSAAQSWLSGWSYPILIVLFLGMNYLSIHTQFFKYDNKVFGLNYSPEKSTTYSVKQIEDLSNRKDLQEKSKQQLIKILDNWKKSTGELRPKLVFINSSGGGSRSTLWTFNVLQELQKVSQNQFYKHVQLITGASGGMIGAAYFRELILRENLGENVNPVDSIYRAKIGLDLLNRLAFSASTNDIFFRYQKIKINDYIYKKDRGYSFELQLNNNLDNYLNHSLGYYKEYEENAKIPMIIFSPTIVNDGRRLLISSQNLSCLTQNESNIQYMTKSYENIDYQTFFYTNTPQETRFTSVIRMSATFPYVLPMCTLPTNPEIQVMDAGIRDNYGVKTMMEYLYVLQDWIKENTSGIVIVQIRDTKKVLSNELYNKVSLMDKLTIPFGNMYSNFTRTQDFDQEELLKIGLQSVPFSVDMISFNLRENWEDKISLSLHLTSREKLKIKNAWQSKSNQAEWLKLLKVMGMK